MGMPRSFLVPVEAGRKRTVPQERCQAMFAENTIGRFINAVDASPWAAASGRAAHHHDRNHAMEKHVLYTPEERRRRDASPWTLVQGILAPIQFAVFLMSLGLVLRYLATGDGLTAATASIVVKTLVLYTIMITGAIWEHAVFGKYLFARAFFWEDVFSMLVLGLHTAYLAALFSGAVAPRDLMLLALAAYTAYVVNATQFVLKLRAARKEAAVTGQRAGLLT
jgi:3-vinyl bacteriochlorophyllide hydratase